jgi:hypothetical protein
LSAETPKSGMKLAFMGRSIDVLTPEQERYLNESGI